MNDFLKSLRNQNKARFDKSNRKNYGGNPQYRGNEKGNRRMTYKSPEESLSDIKTAIERLTEIGERRIIAEQRQADMLERIGNYFRILLKIPPEQAISEIHPPLQEEKQDDGQDTASTGVASSEQGVIVQEEPAEGEDSNAQSEEEFTPDPERDKILNVIFAMRDKGSTYNEIASHLENENVPTFSGKGNWHPQTIHRICQANNHV